MNEHDEPRALYLFEDINQASSKQIIHDLHKLEAESPEDIPLYINSDGGEVYSALAIINAMELSPCDIPTYVMGIAYSGACLLASAGTKGKRYAGIASQFMDHEAWQTFESVQNKDFEYHKKRTARLQRELDLLFSRYTGQSVSKIRETFNDKTVGQDTYLNAREAKAFGIVDHVIGNRIKRQ